MHLKSESHFELAKRFRFKQVAPSRIGDVSFAPESGTLGRHIGMSALCHFQTSLATNSPRIQTCANTSDVSVKYRVSLP